MLFEAPPRGGAFFSPQPFVLQIAPFPVQLVCMSFCELQLPQVGCHNIPRSGRLPVNWQTPLS